MSDTLDLVRTLVGRGDLLISRHGYRELAADDILPDEIVAGVEAAEIVEDYPWRSEGLASSFFSATPAVGRCTLSGAFRDRLASPLS